ncbi:MAG: prepilin-type N-terminal cleavage/methylation domain-containing protein [Desulfobacterales bacterium]|nr:prepilin-type N-terminal cleavage/methylation domain-containing protein [Desulfobacterales bacterium]
MRRASPPQRGFTLLELLVVMGIVVLLFLFTLPNLDSFTLTDPPKKVAALIATTCKDLKIRARKERKRFRLDVLSDTGEIWVTHEDMDEKERAQAREGGFTLPEEMSVACLSNSLVVDKETGAKGIFFYPEGYSDPADIEVRYGERVFLVTIEPLIPRATFVERKEF